MTKVSKLPRITTHVHEDIDGILREIKDKTPVPIWQAIDAFMRVGMAMCADDPELTQDMLADNRVNRKASIEVYELLRAFRTKREREENPEIGLDSQD